MTAADAALPQNQPCQGSHDVGTQITQNG